MALKAREGIWKFIHKLLYFQYEQFICQSFFQNHKNYVMSITTNRQKRRYDYIVNINTFRRRKLWKIYSMHNRRSVKLW